MEHWTIVTPGSGRLADEPEVDLPLFSSEGWAKVLVELGGSVHLVLHEPSHSYLQIPVFKRWGLRIGFLGFPVPVDAINRMTRKEFESECRGLASALSLDFVRGAWSSRGRCVDAQAAMVQPEAWIESLQDWNGEAGSKRLAKDMAYCRRSCSGFELDSDGLDSGAGLFELYAQAVVANGGRVRYTRKYFDGLVGLARTDPRLQVVYARDQECGLAGFAVLACNEQTGYYLHGAVSPVGRRKGLSDLLLDAIVGRAKTRGMREFSLMASPAGQHGLLAFKRKWSSRVDSVVTVDTGHGPLGSMAALALRVRQRVARQMLDGGRRQDGH